QWQRSKSEHERMTDLAASGSVTRKLLDEALNALTAAEAAKQEAAARVSSAKAGVAEAEANREKARSDHAAAEARVAVAESNLAAVRTMLAYTELRAPFDGVVTQRNVDVGHMTRPGDNKPLLV